jgi:PIN domain nuclease of toxin-antitoxin system
MRLLLDTHVWLWWRLNPDRLNRRARKMIESGKSELYLSAASAWELAIKSARERQRLPGPVDRFILDRLHEDRIEELPVTSRHATHTATLPDLHRDPFDRLLIAQARCEGLMLLTADDKILQYGSMVLDAR